MSPNPYSDPKPLLVAAGILIGILIGVLSLTSDAAAAPQRSASGSSVAASGTVEVPTAEAVRVLERRLAVLERRLAAIEALLAGPLEPPTRPPTRPPSRPPVAGGWPAVSALQFEMSGGGAQPASLSFPVPAADEWALEPGPPAYRFCVRRAKFGGGLAVVFLEQFAGFDATRITWTLADAFHSAGAILFDDLSVAMGGEVLYEVKGSTSPGPDAIQVRGMLARRHFLGPDAARLRAQEQIDPVEGYPEWVGEVNSDGLKMEANSARAIGLYRLADPSVKGPSSLNGSHGGWKVAPWHMGPDGWQRATREGYRWAEMDMLNTLDRSPLAVFDPATLHPLNQHSPYWPGRANVTIPGFSPDPDPACPYLPELEKWEAHAYSHLHRETCAAAMLAPRDVFARWLLVEVYWHDISLWLDGGESGVDLFKTANQILRELPSNAGWGNGGRGFAHSVRAFLYAEPYMPAAMRDDSSLEYRPEVLDSTGERWRDVITALVSHTARPNGVIHSMARDHKFSSVAPSARAREVDLFWPNFSALGLDDLGERCRQTMARLDGASVAEAFDPRFDHWSGGEFAIPDYYPLYDLIRGDSLFLLDLNHRWVSPNEQLISMVSPEILFEAGK